MDFPALGAVGNKPTGFIRYLTNIWNCGINTIGMDISLLKSDGNKRSQNFTEIYLKFFQKFLFI